MTADASPNTNLFGRARRVTRLRRLGYGVALILVVAAVAGGLLVHRGSAQKSAQKGLLAPNPDLIKAAAAPTVVRNGLPSILESDGVFSVRRDGSTSPIVMCSTCHVLEDFTWSPSGRFLAYADTSIEVSTGDEGINIVDLRTHRRLKILRGFAFVHGLAWSRDGSKLAYAVESDTGGSELRVIRADGSAQAVTVNIPWATPSSPTWSPDGQWLAYDVQHGGHPTSTSQISQTRTKVEASPASALHPRGRPTAHGSPFAVAAASFFSRLQERT